MIPAPGVSASALGAAEFKALMARLGPFESHPHMAAGVSGGADSMALAVLLHRWTVARGGQFTALIVNHGLRAGASAEAAGVGRCLRSLGIAHRVLSWRGEIPEANVPAQARRIRHDLLAAWCARRGILHLALGHHREDQAETFLLRLGRGSGLDGLAAMAAVASSPHLRLIRPLLDVPKARLVSTLEALKLGWVEDPTNQDHRYARARIRALAAELAGEGLNPERLAATASRLGRARRAIETAVAGLSARAVGLHPAGFARVDAAQLTAAPDEIALRTLARVLMTVGGLDYAPRLDRLERLLDRLRGGLAAGATLGRCRILPRARPGPHLLVVREERAVPDSPLPAGQTVLWDNRFEVRVMDRGRRTPASVAALGLAGWAALRPQLANPDGVRIPVAARPSLPALRDRSGLLAVPHLGFRRPGMPDPFVSKCRFAPKNGLTVGPLQLLRRQGALC